MNAMNRIRVISQQYECAIHNPMVTRQQVTTMYEANVLQIDNAVTMCCADFFIVHLVCYTIQYAIKFGHFVISR